MLVSNNQTLTLAEARKAIRQELAGMVRDKVESALQAVNAHNINVENKVKEAEAALVELDKAAETQENEMVKLMWPTFRATKLQEIEAIRAQSKPVPTPESLEAFFLDDVSARIMSALTLQESVPNVRKPRGGDSSFDGIWGSAYQHTGKAYMVVNYRLIPDSVKETHKLPNERTWVLLAQNQNQKWYVKGTFEATSPSNVILNARRIITENPALTQTNLDNSAWCSNNTPSMKNLLSLDSEKAARLFA